MNDTCATHRSRVPRRSFGRNKRRSDDIGRRERTRPGFYFMFCVRQSSARGCCFSVIFGYAPGSRRGGCRPRGSGGVAPFAWRPKPAAIRHVWGGAGNGGLAAGCPRPEEPPPSARRRMSIGPSTKEVQYHRMAPRVNRSAG